MQMNPLFPPTDSTTIYNKERHSAILDHRLKRKRTKSNKMFLTKEYRSGVHPCVESIFAMQSMLLLISEMLITIAVLHFSYTTYSTYQKSLSKVLTCKIN